ncbi:hypothetical protein Y032_0252g246 [Ancylostoma ceylanicum]|nr:hypothetical protein Y032_0252g246 [Ancylostoma ceylanicum]
MINSSLGWTCESDDNLQYCMTVHSCTADDGQGIGQQIIDEKGCTLDNFLMKNLDYGDNLVAGQEAHVFKFADKPTIFFACMIRLELKEDVTSACMHSSEHCSTHPHHSQPIETPNRIDRIQSIDFPKPLPTLMHDRINFQVDSGDKDMVDTDSDKVEYQFIRSQRDTYHTYEVDVSAPSVEVIDLPELDADFDQAQIDVISLREVQVCISRLSLGIGLCTLMLLAGISVCMYLTLSLRKRKGLCRQPIPHPDLS